MTLVQGHERRTFVIIDDTDADRGRGELWAHDPVAGKLLGLRVGDTVSLGPDGSHAPPFAVESVRAAYSHAAGESYANAPTLFGDDSPFVPMQLTPDDPKGPIWQHLDGYRRHMVAVVQAYDAGHASIGLVARTSGRSSFEIWRGFVADRSIRIRVADGADAPRLKEIERLRKPGPLFLEATALCTIAYLRLEQQVRSAFPEFRAHVATLEEVLNDLELVSIRSAGTLIALPGAASPGASCRRMTGQANVSC